jgi:hypothetical protein
MHLKLLDKFYQIIFQSNLNFENLCFFTIAIKIIPKYNEYAFLYSVRFYSCKMKY